MSILQQKNYTNMFPQLDYWLAAVFFRRHFVSFETKLKILLAVLVALTILPLQLLFRDLDNNRLLSWQWVMDQDRLFLTMAVSAIGFVFAYIIVDKSACIRLSERSQLLMLIVGSYILGTLAWSLPEFMVDSGRYFAHAKIISTQGFAYFLTEWGSEINAWTDLPLASLVYGLVFTIFGESRLAIQVVATLFFSASVYLTFLLGKDLWDAKTGLIAALSLLAIPFLHVQVSQMLVDVPAMFFALLAIYLSFIAIKKPGVGRTLLASISILAAMLTKYSVWIAVSAIALLPLLANEGSKRFVWKRLFLLSFATSLLLIFVAYLFSPVIIEQQEILLNYQLPALQRWQEGYTSTFLFQIHPFVSLAAVLSIYFAVKKKDINFILPFFVLGMFILMGGGRARYLLIGFPFLALMAAFGIRQLSDQILGKFIVSSAVVVSVTITLIANTVFLQNQSTVNLQNAARYLDSLGESNVAVMVSTQPATDVNPDIAVPMLDYYLGKRIFVVNTGAVTNAAHGVDKSISPLRFTWDVEPYAYPKIDLAALSEETIVVLITAQADQRDSKVDNFLPHYVHVNTFAIADRVFRFQSIVSVYRHKANGKKST